jgi:hypothetical protein
MTISRAQMASQLTGNKMKKKPAKRKALGGLMGAAIKEGGIANLSPAVAVAKSLKSGRPEGMLRLSPLAISLMAEGAAAKMIFLRKPNRKSDIQRSVNSSNIAQTRGMKRGGKMRGDGICQHGNTKGAMR